MIYKVLSDIVIVVHFLWILFLIFGGYVGRKHKKVRLFHISGLGFALFIQGFDLYCPLTYLEIYLKKRHFPEDIYAGSFIIHYLERLIYIQISHSTVLILTFLVVGINLFLYLRLFKHRLKRSESGFV